MRRATTDRRPTASVLRDTAYRSHSVSALPGRADRPGRQPGASSQAGSPPHAFGAAAPATGSPDADRSDDAEPTKKGEKTPAASSAPSRTSESRPTGLATTAAPTKTSGGGTNGGTTGGGTTGGGGGPTTRAPSCFGIGGGKYNCEVWKTATSYTASGTEVGVLNAGTNYFYCQQNLGRRETYGEWTNVWWAKTDGDSGSGNTNVFVSDVYLKGGNNDEPVPGLPVC
ncbi:hypothetical protein [Streptomyces dysideae]|uniref:Uncharacterized protein n=1 Tax=Streptomyces dysideae TaxID=909626 RepID=A0A101UTD1_9ACTN|nr:hypothetical protein [Streptomyces dysideae]KUO16497.1 hypothetical protein AQJ91_34940 [Streptomyces dysideae]